MKKSKMDYNYIFIILVLLILCLFPSFTNTYTSAEERVYSGVLEDLQKMKILILIIILLMLQIIVFK